MKGINTCLPKTAIYYAVFSLFAQCSQLDRQKLLEGNFGNVDSNPPQALSPGPDEKIVGLSVTLTWTAARGASQYSVEIASDAGFSQPIAGSPFKSSVPNLTMIFPDAYSYYWRVRANTTQVGSFSTVQRVHLQGNALRVYCPAATVCTNAGKFGNKTLPYQVIGEVLSEAVARGFTVEIARRDALNTAYDETLNVLGGSKVVGGYDAATWQKTGAKTRIARDDIEVVTIMGVQARETYLENLEIESLYTQGSNSAAISLFSVDNTVAVRQCSAIGGKGTGASVGILLSLANPTITDNQIFGGTGSASTKYGIQAINGSSPLIERNRIHGGAGAQTKGISTSATSAAEIRNNIVYGGDATADSVGIELLGNETIRNNSVHAGSGSTGSTGISFSATPILINNLVFTRYGTTRYSFKEVLAGNAQALKNNNVFDMGASGTYYAYKDSGNNCGGGTNCSFAQMVALADIPGGNSGNINISNTGNQLLENIPERSDITMDGPDAASTYDGTTSVLEVRNCQDGRYVVGQYLEYNRDGIARQITSVNCTASTSLIGFSPALSTVSVQFVQITLWALNNANLVENWQLKPATVATCEVLFGGMDLSANFTVDAANISRMALLPSVAPCSGLVTNTGAAGWSIGAYERDN